MLVAIVLFGTSNSWGQTSYKLEQVTSVEAGGLYVFEQDGYVMNNTVNSSALQCTNSYLTSNLTGNEKYVWTLTEGNGGFYMKNVSNGNTNCFLKNASSTSLSLANTSSGEEGGSIWAFNFQGDGTVLIQNTGNGNRFLGFAENTHNYKAYATSNLEKYSHAIRVYQLVEAIPTACSSPTFSPAAGIFTGSQSVTLTSSTEGATIYYTTDGTDPTEASTQYTAPITVNETTTIKAIAVKEGMDNSAVASATYTKVNHAGTEADPYSVADARAAIDAGAGITGVYATGIVSAIPTPYDSGYGNITFNLVDELGNEVFLQAYRCGGDDAANVEVGDIVVVFGNLTKYNSTYEFAQGCTLVSLTKASVAMPTFSPAAGTYTGAQNVTIACETEGATIKYSFDNETWQDYSEAIQLSEYGTFTIYAKAVKGTDESAVASATYTIEDPNAPGTENNPYTVAQARAAIDAGTGITGVYVKGIVSGIVTAFNSQYGNISFNISDNGTTTANQLEAYRCFKGANEEHFTSEDDIQVGDEVVLFGNLKLFNSTYELNEGNYLVSLNRPVVPTFTLSSTSNTAQAELAHIPSGGSIFFEVSNYEGTDFHAVYCDAEGNTLEENPYAEWFDIFYNSEDPSNIYYLQYHYRANNTSSEPRFAYARLYVEVDGEKYYSDIVTFKQEGYVAPNFAELPFTFDGGKTDIANTSGLTQDGLGTDYSSGPKLKFDSTGDYVLLKFNERPGKLTFDIKGNSFSGGTFTVQTSEDGETYTNLESYTELGDTQSESFDNLGENVRYIKWIYTEKSNGNVGLDNIKLEKYDSRPTVSAGTLTGVTSLELWDGDMENIEVGGRVTPGTTVFVKPVLEADYTLETIEATDAAGSPITLTENSGAWSFTMPETNVTINVTAIEDLSKKPTLSNDNIVAAGNGNSGYAEYQITDNNGKTWNAYAIKGSHSNATSKYHYLQIKKFTNNTAYFIQVPEYGTKITSLEMTVSGASQPMDGAGNSATIYFSSDNTTSAESEGVASGTGTSTVTINCSALNINTGYITASGAVRIWDVKVVYEEPTTRPGDVNHDGDVTIADVTALVNIILGKDTEGVYDHEAADVNDDDEITIADVTALVNIILGKN